MALTCTNCGYAYNADNALRCVICSAPMRPANNISLPQSRYIEQGSDTAALPPSPPRPSSIPNEGEVHQKISPASLPGDQPDRDMLYGRVSHVERYDERPRTDAYKVMASILIGLLVLIPFGALFLISGILSFAFAFIGFSSLSQLFNPIIWTTSSFELLEVMVLRRMSRTDTLPVYRGMVEDRSGQEYAFTFRGPLNSGNLVTGHHVRLTGQWQRGTFMVRHGNDLTANAAISSAYRNPWRVIFFGILGLNALIALGILLYLKGIIG